MDRKHCEKKGFSVVHFLKRKQGVRIVILVGIALRRNFSCIGSPEVSTCEQS